MERRSVTLFDPPCTFFSSPPSFIFIVDRGCTHCIFFSLLCIKYMCMYMYRWYILIVHWHWHLCDLFLCFSCFFYITFFSFFWLVFVFANRSSLHGGVCCCYGTFERFWHCRACPPLLSMNWTKWCIRRHDTHVRGRIEYYVFFEDRERPPSIQEKVLIEYNYTTHVSKLYICQKPLLDRLVTQCKIH